MNTCQICNKEFQTALGLAGHKRTHGPSNGTLTFARCSCIYTKKVMIVRYLEDYQKSLKECKYCLSKFKPNTKRKYFCNCSCAAKYNNQNKVNNGYKLSDEQKAQIGYAHIIKRINNGTFKINRINMRYFVIGVYSKVTYRTCICGKEYYSSNPNEQKCNVCRRIYNCTLRD